MIKNFVKQSLSVFIYQCQLVSYKYNYNSVIFYRSGQFVLKQGNVPFGVDVVSFVRLFTATIEQLKSWEKDDIESIKEQLLLKKWVHGDEKVLEFLEKR